MLINCGSIWLLVFRRKCTLRHGVPPGRFIEIWCPMTSAVFQNAQGRNARHGRACKRRLHDGFVHLHLFCTERRLLWLARPFVHLHLLDEMLAM